MKRKVGRPTDNPKDKKTTIRLSENDIQKLDYCTEKSGKSRSEIIRIGIDKVYQQLREKEK